MPPAMLTLRILEMPAFAKWLQRQAILVLSPATVLLAILETGGRLQAQALTTLTLQWIRQETYTLRTRMLIASARSKSPPALSIRWPAMGSRHLLGTGVRQRLLVC